MLCVAGVAGCILPESIDFIDDTAPNYPPTVTATDPQLDIQAPIPPAVGREFTPTIEDRNLDDTLHIRVFVDLYVPGTTPPFYVLGALAQPGQLARQVPLRILCGQQVPMDNQPHTLTAVIADRPFLEDSTIPPAFRAVPDGAGKTEVTWENVTCE